MFPVMRLCTIPGVIVILVFGPMLINVPSESGANLLFWAGLAGLCGVLMLLGFHAEDQVKTRHDAMASRIQCLEGQVKACAADLKRASADLHEQQAKLSQADRLSDLGQLTATVSHEIRNPLSVIRTAVHVMRKKAAVNGVDLERPLDRAQRAVARCDDIVNDMLEYARSNELSRENVDSSSYLNEILDEQTLPDSITLERTLPKSGLLLSIDRDRFRRVIINLISNAAEAIKEGDVEEGRISVTCVKDEKAPAIHIFNNGPAIPDDVVARMYEPLYTTKSTGSGIGLPTVKKLVEQHGAELLVDTREDVGTTWTIALDAVVVPVSAEDRDDVEQLAA